MAVLEKSLRAKLETTVKNAREVAEKASLAALKQLAIEDAKAPDYLTEAQKDLRRRLRAHGRALGDKRREEGSQELQHLVWEISYEHWHRMLFARFLAENNLLMWEPGAAVSLDDCRDIVESHPELAMGAKSRWDLAGKLAARMLPQVFKPKNPTFELNFSTEEQRALEVLLDTLSQEVFHASDSLGWVYQFWQSKRKDEVNQAEVKIGADELPAVTQLFTESYMVEFLLQNSLGAWWLSRHPGEKCPCELPYLRIGDEGFPVAGQFNKWPDTLADFKLLDPSCGSGHFLVASFLLLVPMRMKSENITAGEAINAVLADNLYGLEIDQRCVEIAVFALALAAWTYPDESGVPVGITQENDKFNIACCGLKVSSKIEDWQSLVPKGSAGEESLRSGLAELHMIFSKAPLLGSLLDPSKTNQQNLFSADFEILEELLNQALSSEVQQTIFDDSQTIWDSAISAKGLLEAAAILSKQYDLVITNVPYLQKSKQEEGLKSYCEKFYPSASNDLANVFLDRCLELCKDNDRGLVQVVMPQNWLFLKSYRGYREKILKESNWVFLARLGSGAFETIGGEVVQVILLSLTKRFDSNFLLSADKNLPAENFDTIYGIDVSEGRTTLDKSRLLKTSDLKLISQKKQLNNPDSIISLEHLGSSILLKNYCSALTGLQSGDDSRFVRNFWEISSPIYPIWLKFQGTPKDDIFGGKNRVVRWDNGAGSLVNSPGAYIRSKDTWDSQAIAIKLMTDLQAALFESSAFDMNVGALHPKNHDDLPAIWAYVSSDEFEKNVRKINQKLNVSIATLTNVPFDIERWRRDARNRFPQGLPIPFSNKSNQWIFHGHPKVADSPLQVAVARLLGYMWPAENDESIRVSGEAESLIKKLEKITYDVNDGIICLPSIRGEKPGHERLLDLLISSWNSVDSSSWDGNTLDKLLENVGHTGKNLDTWLRDKFFDEHCKLYSHTPFIWHIWDGLKDGFSALVNYHLFNRKLLEKLIHTYLGDWIRQQELGAIKGVDGAVLRLEAAKILKEKLEKILEGEKPYDIFVRWKDIQNQPLGWHPDFNDGVRVNIRPFVVAEVLRSNKKPKLNINWEKDRGKDPSSSPWFNLGLEYGGEEGDRINVHHLSLAEKIKAQNE